MTSPWVDGEFLNAATMYARTTSPINAVATSVSGALADSGWTSMFLSAGTGTAKYRRIGSLVEVVIAATGQSIPSGSTGTVIVGVTGIPSGTAPVDTIYGACNFGGQVSGLAVINPAGSVSALNNSGATVTTFRCSVTYLAG